MSSVCKDTGYKIYSYFKVEKTLKVSDEKYSINVMINGFSSMPVHSSVSLHLRELNKSSMVVCCNLKRISKPSIQCVILVILYKYVLKTKKDADYLGTCIMVKYHVN